MNRNWNPLDPEQPANLAPPANDEPSDDHEVERWLAEHPEAARDADSFHHLVRLYRDHAPTDPSPAAWQTTLDRIESDLAGHPPATRPGAWRFRLLAGLVAAAAAVLGGVVLARTLWPTPRTGPITPLPIARDTRPLDDDEPLPVASFGEVNIIRMSVRDADSVVMGQPLIGKVEFAASEDIHILNVMPDPEEGRMPHLQRVAGSPMIILARGDEDDDF